MFAIVNVYGREILDSRGIPAVQVEVVLENGSRGRASVPSGSSTGSYEAQELRDGGKRYRGKGVLKALERVNEDIFSHIVGLSAFDQVQIDQRMIALDGTQNKNHLGANAILGVSLAVAKACSQALKIPLYRYLGGVFARTLPTPLINILNGGMHSGNSLDVQEFMILPLGADSFKEALEMSSDVFYALRDLLSSSGYATNVGDEGGFAPELKSSDQALSLIMQAIEKAGYSPGKDICLALDVAATELFHKNKYHLKGEGKILDTQGMISYLESLVHNYPIVSIEDGLSEDDWCGWRALTEVFGEKIQLVGDDLFATNVQRLQKGFEHGVGNSILIKPNQVGSLSETLKTIEVAHRASYTAIVSHRSGETEDTMIADLAVASNCGQIKAGSLSRSERLAKYNRLLRIEEELGNAGKYSGWDTLKLKGSH